jgi:hypothetical protein
VANDLTIRSKTTVPTADAAWIWMITMAEYVEREALIKEVADIGNTAPMIYAGGLSLALTSVRSAPAADVVPVVRCKDCKHGTRLVCDLAGNEGIVCRHGNIARKPDWFCADGAKVDSEEN